ncbi:hypothetical protein SAMN05216480_10246 [Pustulibacterium marinum]|uniref:Succinylglutamate desuccinylase / Aspartoacylase family protein n=2 Tax=Pustulibacterium marinum TaxID=1224947 RepID=A0A1I7FN41_9FLAO|nr:hypothetical protein SAMN05216480_10246 [Pustulibacterium marinum]
MHAGDANEDLLPFICYYNNTHFTAQTQLAAQLCDVSGFENIVSYPYHLAADQPAEYAFKQAVQQGIPALSIEMGKLGNVNPEEISTITNAVHRMLNYMNMYQKATPKINIAKNYFTNQAYIPVPMQGLFYSDYKAGDIVTKGTLLGIVKDIFGNELGKVHATATGTILYKIGTPPVTKGQTLFCIGIN